MYKHHETRNSQFSQDQIFDLVIDIEKYPEFLPWCRSLRVTQRLPEQIMADLQFGYKMFADTFSTIVNIDREHHKIQIRYLDGPFKSLNSEWQLLPNPDDPKIGCVIDFKISFEFRTKVLDLLLGKMFNQAVIRMIHAFEERAKRLYE